MTALCICGHPRQFHSDDGECRWSSICHCLQYDPDPTAPVARTAPPEPSQRERDFVGEPPEFDENAERHPFDDRDYSEAIYRRERGVRDWWSDV